MPGLSIQLPPAVAESDRMTLARTREEALSHSPAILAAKEQVAAAKANLGGQRAPANPTLTYSGLNNTVTSFDFREPSNYAVILPVETNGAMQWRTSQARNQFAASRADLETVRIGVLQSAMDAYVDLQVANASLKNEREAYATAQKLSDLTEKQFSLGAAPETNAIRTKIALTQEEGNLLTAIGNVKSARANLNIQIGRNANEPIDVAEALNFEPIQLDLARLREMALVNRPELRSAALNERALRATVGLERTQFLPDLFFGTDFRAVRRGAFQIGLSVPLVDFGSIRGAVKKAQQDVKVQEAQTTGVRQSVTFDVETGFDNLQRTLRTVQAFQDGILPRSASLLERIEKGYQLGASTILDLLDAQSTYRSTRNDYAAALGDYRHAMARIERAIGGPLASGASPSPASTAQK